jgi:DNA-binding beta-propeller fold protein YncE
MRGLQFMVGLSLSLVVAASAFVITHHANGDALLYSTAAGTDPISVGVDERTRRAFVADAQDSVVRMFDVDSGAVLRTTSVRASPAAVTMDEPTSQAFIRLYHDPGSPPIFAAVLDTRTGAPLQVITGATATVPLAVTADATGRVFALATTTVRVLNPRTGATLHIFPLRTGGFPATLVADARSHRVIVFSTCCVDVYSAETGHLLHRVALPSAVDEAAMDEQTGRVFAISRGSQDAFGNYTGNGAVRILAAATGRVLRTTEVGRNPSAVAIDTRTGRVFIANRDSNTLSILDARSGTLIRTVRLPYQPIALAIDQQAGHLLLLTGSGGQPAATGGWVPAWLRSHLPFLAPSRSGTSMQPRSLTILDESRL